MYRRVLVFDYDGTLAENNRIPTELCQALEQLAATGFSLFLATGRLYQLAMEEGHVDWAGKQRTQIEQMGLENYLTIQTEDAAG